MQQIPFVKTHNAGNDFILILKDHLPPVIPNFQQWILTITDRNFGIGCDQLILYQEQDSQYIMEIYNNDASIASACGNATLCLMNLLHNKYGLKNAQIKVGARLLSCYIEEDYEVVDMGYARFDAEWMPAREKLVNLAASYGIADNMIQCVDVGNRHLVLLSDTLTYDQYLIIGQQLVNHPLFPGGININFCKIVQEQLELRVWERGVGMTLACGSGACASFAAISKLGLIAKQAIVNFSRGHLLLSKVNNSIIMKGKAQLVGKGEYYG